MCSAVARRLRVLLGILGVLSEVKVLLGCGMVFKLW